MIIGLTTEQMKNIDVNETLIIDGEKLEKVDKETEMDDNGKTELFFFHRKRDNKTFMVTLFYCRYGYEDYGYESSMQNNRAVEVVKVPVTKYEWQVVTNHP